MMSNKGFLTDLISSLPQQMWNSPSPQSSQLWSSPSSSSTSQPAGVSNPNPRSRSRTSESSSSSSSSCSSSVSSEGANLFGQSAPAFQWTSVWARGSSSSAASPDSTFPSGRSPKSQARRYQRSQSVSVTDTEVVGSFFGGGRRGSAAAPSSTLLSSRRETEAEESKRVFFDCAL